MKKFSLKALGAILLGFVLAVSTLVAPANAAATAAWNGTAPTFTTGPSPAMNINFTAASAAQFRQVAISVRNAAGTAVPTGVTIDASSVNCKLVSLTGSNVTNANFCNRFDASQGSAGPRFGYSVQVGSTGSFNLQVQSGVFGGLSNGSYSLWVGTTDDFTLREFALIPFTVGPVSSTVTFDGNGSTSGATAAQTSAVSAALTSNGFSKTGYTFSGWNTAANGSGTAYANGATYSFSSSTTLFAQWTANGGGGGGSTPSASLSLSATQGQLVAGSSVAIVASGLQPTAPYTVVVRSTPQTIGTGNAVNGAVNTSVTLPAGLSAGWHSLTFSSTASDGSAMSSVLYFEVSSTGTLLATSSTIPAALANTGFDSAYYLAGGLALAVVGGGLMLIARRKASQ